MNGLFEMVHRAGACAIQQVEASQGAVNARERGGRTYALSLGLRSREELPRRWQILLEKRDFGSPDEDVRDQLALDDRFGQTQAFVEDRDGVGDAPVGAVPLSKRGSRVSLHA